VTRDTRIPADAGRGLGQVVLAVLEIVGELLERQALRRMAAGSLSPDEVERLGLALISLRRQFTELRTALGIDEHTETGLPANLADLLEQKHPHQPHNR
jgi:hypothetical protein